MGVEMRGEAMGALPNPTSPSMSSQPNKVRLV